MKKLFSLFVLLAFNISLFAQPPGVTTSSSLKIPSMVGNANKYLKNDGSKLIWATPAGGGTVSIAAISPLFETAGTFSIQPANTGQNGYLSANDWNTFNGKQSALGFTPYNSTNPSGFISLGGLSANSPLFYDNSTGTFSIQPGSISQHGYLSTTTYSLFNNKQDALVSGTNIKTVNGSTLLGSGNLAVGDVSVTATQTLTNKTIDSGVFTGTTSVTGTVTAPTVTITSNDNSVATTSFVTRADNLKENIISGISTLGADNYTVTYSPAITSYSAGFKALVTFTAANTTTATINFNGLGVKNIVKGVSTSLVSGDITAGASYWLLYDGTNFVLINSSLVNQKTNYSPTFTGVVTPPVPTHAYYIDQDKFFELRVGIPLATGSGTTRSMTLPFTVTETQNFSMPIYTNSLYVMGSCRVIGGTNVLDFYPGIIGTAFTTGHNFIAIVSLTLTK